MSRRVVGQPANVPDKTGIPYFPVGRPVNVPDKTGIPYFPVGRNFIPIPESG
jgi:hypothetical protein